TSLVEVVSGYVTLRKAGRNHLGLCPFHAEKTPSFTVNEERGLFHCFGCGAGGTVFTFLMKANRVDFREAVEILAKRAGVTLPKGEEQGPAGRARQELLAINEAAQEYFVGALRSDRGAAAREYLKRRGVGEATSSAYGLGFCPPGGSGLARSLAARRLSLPRAAELGLVGRRTDGSAYDRLWDRVTFPIRDVGGRIVGFGGRTLGNNHPKYLNSPESALFHKGEVLYGLFEARQAIRQAERVVIVEGYLDVLALVEAGIDFAVASLGTALGAGQLQLAKRFAPEVIAFFDGDRAGQNAAVRAFRVCADSDVWGLGAFLPEGFDPDTFVRAHGKSATLALLQHAVPLADFFINFHAPAATASDPERVRAAQKIAEDLRAVRDPVKFSLLARKASQQLGVGEDVFRTHRPAPTSPRSKREQTTDGIPSKDAPVFRPEEIQLVEAMALDQKVAELVQERQLLERFESALLADAGRQLVAAWQDGVRGASIVDRLPAAIAERLTASLVGAESDAPDNQLQVAEQCMSRVEDRKRRAQSRVLREQIQRAEARGDRDGSLDALRRADELRQRRGSPWN
ncbi:MAG TPA: DNA primase, partial [Candidatus Acidoferrales bacterium]|nr:DNA primase [Candidatus Acidoferrales bacterium]